MASSSSSKKRTNSDRENDFQSLTGLGISDTAVRKVIARLQGDDAIEKSAKLRESKKRFKDIADFIVDVPAVDKENNLMELHFVNVEIFFKRLVKNIKILVSGSRRSYVMPRLALMELTLGCMWTKSLLETPYDRITEENHIVCT